MKKQHAILDPKKNSRYLRRHPEERGLLTDKERAGRARESFLDRKSAGRQR
jgi:hypothetical protein|nr:hypothetical protein [uncultured Acetatifactor sp.]